MGRGPSLWGVQLRAEKPGGWDPAHDEGTVPVTPGRIHGKRTGPFGLFPEQLRDEENHNSAGEAAAEQEINQRVADSGDGRKEKGEINHVGGDED